MSDPLHDQLQLALGASATLERELGGGGMARVFLAHDVRLQRPIVVKTLSPELAQGLSAERFAREIRLAAALQEPHIVPVLSDGVTADGVPYYIMPFVRGASLRDRMADGPVPVPEVVSIVRDVAKALAYAHRRGIVHRDIKPENVLLSEGTAVVTDFGIAKAVVAATTEAHSRGTTLTSAGMALGTPAYMAPEQAAGDAATDRRADLYALGVVAYELLTGAHPFAGRTAQAVLMAHMTETPVRPRERRPDTPAALDTLVMQLLAKDPAARPQSADDVLRVLDGTLPTTMAIRTRPRGVGVAAVGALLVAVLAIGGYAAWHASAARSSAADAPAAIHTVAVLPFVNTSGSASDDYFSDGLTDELAHALTRVAGLRIAGRTSSYAFKGKSVAAQEIGRALDVAALVSGTVRRAGDRLRVTTQLVSTADGKVLWDSVYESRSTDVFAVQDELTRAVAAALTPALGGGTRVRTVAGRGTEDGEAYDLYLKARFYWLQRGGENVDRAIGLFRQAIARDPSFARAHAGLAMAYSTLPVYRHDSRKPLPSDTLTIEQTVRLTAASAERAAALDSTLADAQLALGIALDLQLRFREAFPHYEKGVSLDPSSATARHWLGMSHLNLGENDAAMLELRHATQLDPLSAITAAALGTTLLYARRFPEAEAAARHALALDSTSAFAGYILAMARVYDGKADSAIAELQQSVRMHPREGRLKLALLFADAAAGHWDDAAQIRSRLASAGDSSAAADPALADLVFGDREPIIRVMTSRDKLLRYAATGMILGCDPFLDPLWSDARFRASMRALTIEPCRLARPWPFPPRPRA